MRTRLGLLITVAVIPLALWAVLPMLSDGSVQSQASSIGSKIDRKKRLIEAKKGHERVLSSTITRYSKRIGSLQGDITVLERKQVAIQTDLDAKRAELSRIQEQLRQEKIRLARLRARLAEARIALANRLVELYKADKPDVITVVLESDGFADLLERTEFMKRVSDQDSRIIDRVRTARAEAKKTAKHLAVLEKRQTKIANAIAARRDAVSRVRVQLVDRRDAFARVRSAKSTALASTRDSRQHLEGDLALLEKESAKIQARLAAAQNGTVPVADGPDQAGLGRADLAGQRSGRVAVRDALGPAARGRRHRGAVGHAGARREGRQGADRRLGQRLRQLHLHRPRRRAVDVLRPPGEHRRLGRPERLAGPGHRHLRLHGPLLRPARALRDAHQRRARQPDGLPLADLGTVGSRCSPSSTSSA